MSGHFTSVQMAVTIIRVTEYQYLLNVFQGRVQFPTGGKARDPAASEADGAG